MIFWLYPCKQTVHAWCLKSSEIGNYNAKLTSWDQCNLQKYGPAVSICLKILASSAILLQTAGKGWKVNLPHICLRMHTAIAISYTFTCKIGVTKCSVARLLAIRWTPFYIFLKVYCWFTSKILKKHYEDRLVFPLWSSVWESLRYMLAVVCYWCCGTPRIKKFQKIVKNQFKHLESSFFQYFLITCISTWWATWKN